MPPNLAQAHHPTSELQIHLDNDTLIMHGSQDESSGCVLRGYVHLNLKEPAKFKAVTLRLTGKIKVAWTECKLDQSSTCLVGIYSVKHNGLMVSSYELLLFSQPPRLRHLKSFTRKSVLSSTRNGRFYLLVDEILRTSFQLSSIDGILSLPYRAICQTPLKTMTLEVCNTVSRPLPSARLFC